MPRRTATVIILCEDQQQEVFVRHWLQAKGFNRRQIRVRRSPVAQGSAEQFVRTQYPVEVQECRRVATYQPVGVSLVVSIDADISSVEERQRQLDRELESHDLERRGVDERIAILVPKRNIETWVHHVMGEEVNEAEIYPKLAKPGACRAGVRNFAQAAQDDPLVVHAPPSLRMAREEIQTRLLRNRA